MFSVPHARHVSSPCRSGIGREPRAGGVLIKSLKKLTAQVDISSAERCRETFDSRDALAGGRRRRFTGNREDEILGNGESDMECKWEGNKNTIAI